MEKRLILIRHAHRDTSDRDADNGLSEKGWEQAHALAEEFVRTFQDQKPELLSSARTRCRETLEPIARLTGQKIRVDARLMEQESDEKFRDLHKRIESFLEDWKEKGPALLIACSHGDWLPLALEDLVRQGVEMKKGAWAELILKDGRVKLSRLLQKL